MSLTDTGQWFSIGFFGIMIATLTVNAIQTQMELKKLMRPVPEPVAEERATVSAPSEVAEGVPSCAQKTSRDLSGVRLQGIAAFAGLFRAGYQLADVCREPESGTIGALVAQPLEAAFCEDKCDRTVAVIIRANGEATIRELPQPVGTFTEMAGGYCVVDSVISEGSNDEYLYFICGHGEAGGLTNWWVYHVALENLIEAQRLTSADPEEYDVMNSAAFARFRTKTSN